MTSAKQPSRPSVATQGRRTTFYWQYCAEDAHVDAAVAALMKAIEGPFRHQSKYTRILLEERFRDLILAAEEGDLEPEEAVKRIRKEPDICMYEMRWSEVPVTPVDRVSGAFGDPLHLHVRLYYVEQEGYTWLLGLHAHEKRIGETDQETRDMQDAEIDIAAGVLSGGASTWCGVSLIGLTMNGNPLDV